MVYVDAILPCQSTNWWPYQHVSHMIADTRQELIDMAQALGLKTRYIQKARKGNYHFDLTPAKREQAIQAGATPLNRKQFIEVLRRTRI